MYNLAHFFQTDSRHLSTFLHFFYFYYYHLVNLILVFDLIWKYDEYDLRPKNKMTLDQKTKLINEMVVSLSLVQLIVWIMNILLIYHTIILLINLKY
jgi:hypothetical protein